jgi:hypothetical protein
LLEARDMNVPMHARELVERLLAQVTEEQARVIARAILDDAATIADAAARPRIRGLGGPRRGLSPGAAVRGLVTPPARLGPNSRLGRQLAAQRGWTGREWACLYTLWLRESGWRSTAQNPRSTAPCAAWRFWLSQLPHWY